MTVRWGFIGAGLVANKALAPAIHASANATLAAVASRDLKRAQALSPTRAYGGGDSYDQIIADPKIDAIYINLANQQHHQWVISALKGGKHVLCEKPLAINFSQAKEMADLAKANGKLLIEAAWLRWHPRFQRAIEVAARGDIGDLSKVESVFSFTADLKDNFRGQAGGGSFLDVGSYQLHLWRALINPWVSPTLQNIDQVFNENGIDLTTNVTANLAPLEGGVIKLSARSSFIEKENQSARIIGGLGAIEFLKGAAFTCWKEISSLKIGNHTEEFPPVDAYQLMVEAVSGRISGEELWVVPIQETLDIAQLSDAIVHNTFKAASEDKL